MWYPGKKRSSCLRMAGFNLSMHLVVRSQLIHSQGRARREQHAVWHCTPNLQTFGCACWIAARLIDIVSVACKTALTEVFSAAVFYVIMCLFLCAEFWYVHFCRGGLYINRIWQRCTHRYTNTLIDSELQLLAVCHEEWKWAIKPEHRTSPITMPAWFTVSFSGLRGGLGHLHMDKHAHYLCLNQFWHENVLHGWNCINKGCCIFGHYYKNRLGSHVYLDVCGL